MKASRRTIARVLAGAAVLGVSGWVAGAQIGTNGTVLGCVGNSGIIRGVDETTGSCRSGDTALSWYTKAGTDATFALATHNHDGRYYTKTESDGRYALQGSIPTRADGPCFDNANRYVDCGNGTVTDTVTGLIWLKQWDCLPQNTYAGANQAAAGLKNGDCGLADKSSPGDWRLATKAEWEATIARAVALGCTLFGSGGPPSLTDDAGTACYGTGAGSSFASVASDVYWGSTSLDGRTTNAWDALLNVGEILPVGKIAKARMWPVRGGTHS